MPVVLRVLLAVALVQALAWTLVVSPLQGPDESDHVAYVQRLAQSGDAPSTGVPADGQARGTSYEEGTLLDQFNLRSMTGARSVKGPFTEVERRNWRAFQANPAKRGPRGDGAGPNPLGKNPPLYYAYESLAYWTAPSHDLTTRLTWMRWANALLYLATIACMWLLTGEVFGRGALWKRTLGTGVVVLHPMLAFMAGVVNADSLLVLVWTAFAWLSVRMVRRGPTLGGTVALFALAAASLLTHGRGLAIVPALAVALLVTAFVHRPAVADAARWVAAGLVVALVPLAIYKLAFATSGGAGGAFYGGEVNAGNGFNLRGLLTTIWQFYLPKLSFMGPPPGPSFGYRQLLIEGFFGQFGSLEVRFPSRVYDLLQAAAGIGLVGLYTAMVARWRVVVRHLPVVLVLLGILLSMGLLLHTASYRSLTGGSGDPLITGRYVLPLVSMFGLAVAWTIGSLPRRASAYVGAAVLGIGVLLQLSALGLTMERFYA